MVKESLTKRDKAVDKLSKCKKSYCASKACGKSVKLTPSALFKSWWKPMISLALESKDCEGCFEGVPVLYRCKKCKRVAPTGAVLCKPEKL